MIVFEVSHLFISVKLEVVISPMKRYSYLGVSRRDRAPHAHGTACAHVCVCLLAAFYYHEF